LNQPYGDFSHSVNIYSGYYFCVPSAILKRRRASQPGGPGLGLPSQEQLKAQREARLKQIEMDAIIRECVIYIFFVLVVYFISYQDRDKRSFAFAQNIKNQFFGGSNEFTGVSFFIFSLLYLSSDL
jgi:hypothetical protein